MATVLRAVGVGVGMSNLDNSFGPQLGSQFDFTLLFEDSILTILPAGLFIAVTPFFFLHYLKLPIYISSGLLLWTKLVS